MTNFKKSTLVAISSLGISGNVSAGAFRPLNHDAKAFARRNALTATADNLFATHCHQAGFDHSIPFRVILKKWWNCVNWREVLTAPKIKTYVYVSHTIWNDNFFVLAKPFQV